MSLLSDLYAFYLEHQGLDASRPGGCCPVAVQRVAAPSAVRGRTLAAVPRDCEAATSYQSASRHGGPARGEGEMNVAKLQPRNEKAWPKLAMRLCLYVC